MALDINPIIVIKNFPEGAKSDNLLEFLTDVDGLYFFVTACETVFAACVKRGYLVAKELLWAF